MGQVRDAVCVGVQCSMGQVRGVCCVWCGVLHGSGMLCVLRGGVWVRYGALAVSVQSAAQHGSGEWRMLCVLCVGASVGKPRVLKAGAQVGKGRMLCVPRGGADGLGKWALVGTAVQAFTARTHCLALTLSLPTPRLPNPALAQRPAL